MNKKFIIIIAFIILICIFTNAFASSYTSRNLGNLAYVLALGIDVGEKAKMKISAQFSKTAIFTPGSGSSSEDSSNIVLTSGEADSIFSALNLINSYIGKELNLAHCSVVIFSEEFAKNGISSEIYSLMNNEEMPPTTNLVVSKCSAYDYLNNSNPNLEKMTIKYYETFSITSRFTGYISDITIGDFYDSLSSLSSSGTAILGGLNSTTRQELSKKEKNSGSSSSSSSGSGSNENSGGSSSSGSSNTNSEQSSEVSPDSIINPEDLTAGSSSVSGNRGSENIGIAVFKDDKFIGELTATQAICHLLITDSVDSCVISIDNPLSKGNITELQIFPTKNPKINVTIESDKPKIDIDLSVNADIMTLEKNLDYQSSENIDKFSDSIEKYMEDQVKSYLNKISKEYETDIANFYTKALSHFSTISEWKQFNWNKNFKNTEFNVNVNADVVASLLITET